MGSCEDLKEQGWHVSPDGFNLITENGTVKDKKIILANALNTDIKDFGSPIISTEIKHSKTGKVVLQIQKIRNIAAPKSKEESQAAPRMLKLILTDGHTSCPAVEIANISSLSRTHTPPGSKLLINCARISSNCILLHPSYCALLGGRVPVLCEKWELAKDISENVRVSAGTDGPPPWVNFGEKIVSSLTSEPFKALASKTAKETTNEFDIHRQDAIAIASTGAVKKVFGGGGKNAQVVETQPTNYRRYNNTRENQSGPETNKEYTKPVRGKRDIKEKVTEKPQKPPEKVSLFDFLEDKLLVNDVDNKTSSKIPNDNNFSKQEVQRVPAQYRETPRDSIKQNSPRFQQQKNMRNMSRGQSSYMEPMRSSNNVTNTTRSSENRENIAVTSTMPTPVESVSKNFAKMSVDSHFASRSLRQHLNLGGNKTEGTKPNIGAGPGGWTWKIGDLCMAKYWEDGKYYNAIVTNLTDRTCVVQFNGYGNVEEVLKMDCIPISDVGQEPHFNANINHNFKGSAGYRNGRRTYSNNRPFNKAV